MIEAERLTIGNAEREASSNGQCGELSDSDSQANFDFEQYE